MIPGPMARLEDGSFSKVWVLLFVDSATEINFSINPETNSSRSWKYGCKGEQFRRQIRQAGGLCSNEMCIAFCFDENVADVLRPMTASTGEKFEVSITLSAC